MLNGWRFRWSSYSEMQLGRPSLWELDPETVMELRANISLPGRSGYDKSGK